MGLPEAPRKAPGASGGPLFGFPCSNKEYRAAFTHGRDRIRGLSYRFQALWYQKPSPRDEKRVQVHRFLVRKGRFLVQKQRFSVQTVCVLVRLARIQTSLPRFGGRWGLSRPASCRSACACSVGVELAEFGVQPPQHPLSAHRFHANWRGRNNCLPQLALGCPPKFWGFSRPGLAPEKRLYR